MSRRRVSPIFAALAGAAVLLWGHDLSAASRGGSSSSGHSGSGSHSGSRSYSGRSGGHSGSGGHYGGHGGYSGGHGGYYGGHGGYYGHGGHGGYYGHGGHYGGYYGHWYPGFGWGYYGNWGWGLGWGYGPWYGYGYYGYPYYGYGDGYRHGYEGANYAMVKTDVDPEEASLYLDGKLIGTADDFDGYPDVLYLGPGSYRLEFRLPGYETLTTEVDASPGRFFRIDNHMKKIPGAKQYGTYEPSVPEGGIVRYFEKRRSRDDSQGPPESWRDRAPRDRQELMVEPDEPSGPDQRMSPDDEEGGPEGEREDDRSVTSRPAAAAPSPGEARIVFDVSPPDAAVYVDDHFAGSARELNGLPAGLAVSAGEHRVTVTCPGYREAATRVEVTGSRIGKASISLKK